MEIYIAYLTMAAAVSERLVEFVAKTFKLDAYLTTVGPKTRVLVYQILSALAGVACFYIMPPQLPLLDAVHPYLQPILLGLVISGGAGAWHDLLGVISAAKTKSATISKPSSGTGSDTSPEAE